jgi:hypothetical protein
MKSLSKLVTAAGIGLLAGSPAHAALLQPLNLDDLARKADRIFSGTVVSVDKGRVAMGGGTLPTITYRISVDRALAGVPKAAGGRQVVEIRMLGDLDEVRREGVVRLLQAPHRPDIAAGQRYLFFVTAPGPTGLSTTVGLGQGLFRITGAAGDEGVVNQYDNVGLFRGMTVKSARARGAVRYADVVERIAAQRRRR